MSVRKHFDLYGCNSAGWIDLLKKGAREIKAGCVLRHKQFRSYRVRILQSMFLQDVNYPDNIYSTPEEFVEFVNASERCTSVVNGFCSLELVLDSCHCVSKLKVYKRVECKKCTSSSANTVPAEHLCRQFGAQKKRKRLESNEIDTNDATAHLAFRIDSCDGKFQSYITDANEIANSQSIYIMENTDAVVGKIKVGRSNHPLQRNACLSSACFIELRAVFNLPPHYTETDAQKVEYRIIEQLKARDWDAQRQHKSSRALYFDRRELFNCTFEQAKQIVIQEIPIFTTTRVDRRVPAVYLTSNVTASNHGGVGLRCSAVPGHSDSGGDTVNGRGGDDNGDESGDALCDDGCETIACKSS